MTALLIAQLARAGYYVTFHVADNLFVAEAGGGGKTTASPGYATVEGAIEHLAETMKGEVAE